MATSTGDVCEFIKISFGGTEFRYCFKYNRKLTQKSRKTAGSLLFLFILFLLILLFKCKTHQKKSHVCRHVLGPKKNSLATSKKKYDRQKKKKLKTPKNF